MCMGIHSLDENLKWKKNFVMNRTEIHFWRTDLTIDLIVVVSIGHR